MTTPRKMLAAAVMAVVALFVTVGVAVASDDEERVDRDEADGTHSFDHHGVGDDNGCNFKYKRDGSKRKHFDGDDDDCPTIYPVTNPPNIPNNPDGPTSAVFPAPPTGYPPIPGFPF